MRKIIILLIVFANFLNISSQEFINKYNQLNDTTFYNFIQDWHTWSLEEQNKENKSITINDSTSHTGKYIIKPHKVYVRYYKNKRKKEPYKIDSLTMLYKNIKDILFLTTDIEHLLDSYFYNSTTSEVSKARLNNANRFIDITYVDWAEELACKSLFYEHFPVIYRIDKYPNKSIIYVQTSFNSYQVIRNRKKEYDISKGVIIEEGFELGN